MRTVLQKSSPKGSKRTMRLIRELCTQRAQLQEEVRQLRAAVGIYQELVKRAQSRPPI